jgi:hypothetical protein
MALGMKEVDYRIAKLEKMKESEREEYLHDRRVPIVLGPDGDIYLIDHHHLVRSCWEVGIAEVPTATVADLSHLSQSALWAKMHKENWVYPYDQLGNGPHDPHFLPENIRGLADDPYRSLAWMAREKGAFAKCEVPFSEFQWASFFRKKLTKHPVIDDFHEALEEALELARTSEAAHLPGHVKVEKK